MIQSVETPRRCRLDEPGCPVQVLATSRSAVWTTSLGTKPWERSRIAARSTPPTARRITSPTSLSDQDGRPNGRRFHSFFGM